MIIQWDLRLVLLICGVVLLLFILVDAYRKRQRARRRERIAREVAERALAAQAPVIEDIGEARVVTDAPLNTEAFTALDDEPDATVGPSHVIAIMVKANDENGFNGMTLLHTLHNLGLRYGKRGIFHRFRDIQAGPIQFSLANALKPGTFNLDDMDNFVTPGVSLFLTIPGPEQPLVAYESMLEIGRKLAAKLNGQLLDSQRVPLTPQMIQEYRELIRNQELERRAD